jgi:hypothetical protein
MKKLIYVGLLLASPMAFAMPTVGDFAAFDVQSTVDGHQQTGVVSYELSSYDAATKKFHERLTAQETGGPVRVGEKDLTTENLVSDKEIADYLSNCRTYGGRAETLTTPAGSFKTCAISTNDDTTERTIWYGKVPFGIVKDDVTLSLTGDRMIVILKSFKNGSKK